MPLRPVFPPEALTGSGRDAAALRSRSSRLCAGLPGPMRPEEDEKAVRSSKLEVGASFLSNMLIA